MTWLACVAIVGVILLALAAKHADKPIETGKADAAAHAAIGGGARVIGRGLVGLLALSFLLGRSSTRLLGVGLAAGVSTGRRSLAHAFGCAIGALVLVSFAASLVGVVVVELGRLARYLEVLPGAQLHRVEGGLPHVDAWRIVAVLVALGLGIAALLALRVVVTRRTLQSRVAFVVLPPEDFEAGEAAVETFTASLAGIRRRIFAWLDRPACAFRVRLTTASTGAPLMVWEVPGRWAGVLRTASAAYPGVELVPLEEYGAAPTGPPTGRRHTCLAELEPSSETTPLRRASHGAPDPLGGLAAVLDDVDVQAGERLEVLVDWLPLSPREAGRWRRRQLRTTGEAEPQRWPGAGAVAHGVERRGLREATWSKLGPGSPLFRVQLLVRAEACCAGRSEVVGACCRAPGLAQRAASTFDAYSSGSNHIRSRWSSRLPLARQWLQLRIRWGWLG